ncbi:MAG: tRNA (N6-isopentenyl adenosine(37)-C2)-methylthiotransferase MiaB [Gemmatimonadota bacterium]|nr:MAG: tRNA (N6-isopentenyl adenosine(37)-C2)-methylthiotransferase MiaB [Gemmatimonadota bacterium]
MMRLYVETYGCQMNVADTELICGLLAGEGFESTTDPSRADVLLVNTCAVRDNAEQRVIGRLSELRRYKRPGIVLGVVGCMAQRLGQQLLDRVSHVDLVIGPDGYRALPELIEGARRGNRATETRFKAWEHYEDVPALRGDGPRAFVTVQRGCDYRCTFCVVPITRGRERSRRLADVVAEVENLVDHGISEVTLLGQTVNSYNDGQHDFADLLSAVGTVEGIRRVRYTSPHPNDFSERVLLAMATVPTVCEHVHLPVQSGSSHILKRMGRRYDRRQYEECVANLRRSIPNLAITTDIIVGFPGETEEDFLATESLVRQIGFDDAFTFKYSQREGTGAVRLPAQVPEATKGERLERIIATVREIACSRNLQLIGSREEVLVEGLARRGELLQSRTRANKVVLISGPAEWIGSYLTVRLTGTTGATFTGVPSAAGKELTIVG